MNSLIILPRYLFRSADGLWGSSSLGTLSAHALNKILIRGLLSGTRGILDLRILLRLR